MKLITAIVRPEKVMDVIKALEQEGYFAFSKWAISGRGKEKGIQVGDVLYQEMAKNMLYITVGDKEKDEVVDIIINSAKSGQYGHYGDGKIFVSDISEAYTIMNDMLDEAGGYIWVKEIKEQN
jgi:nitrogen regulatory protein PII 1